MIRRRKREVPCLRGTMPLALGGMTALVLVVARMYGATRIKLDASTFLVRAWWHLKSAAGSAGSVAMDVSTFSRISARRKVPPVPQRGKYLEIKTESVARIIKRKVPQGNKEESASR